MQQEKHKAAGNAENCTRKQVQREIMRSDFHRIYVEERYPGKQRYGISEYTDEEVNEDQQEPIQSMVLDIVFCQEASSAATVI